MNIFLLNQGILYPIILILFFVIKLLDTLKAIIPVAGAGAKLRPHTYTQPKALMPIAGTTILSYIINQLTNAGVTEFIFVVGYLGEKIHEYVDNTFPGLQAHFIYQNNRQGTAHAIKLGQTLLETDEIIVVFGDTICEYDVSEIINSPYNVVAVKKVDNPRLFGVAEINGDGFIESVVEKPAIPKSNMAMVGIYKIKDTHLLFDALQHIFKEKITVNGDYNLTDALMGMIQKGAKFKAVKVNTWYDCGNFETLLDTNATLLKKHGGNVDEQNHYYENTIIIPPVSIAEGCNIRNCILGPNVAIGVQTSLNMSIVKNSIIGSYTTLNDVVLNHSLIGSDANVKGMCRNLNIGDNTEINFG